jgi:uncharacterized protein (DUF58 family)
MSEQIQRYFAAALGCVIATTWAAAGFGAALAGLIAAAVAYGTVVFAQRRGVLRSSRERKVERTQVSARHRGREPARSGIRARPVVNDRAQPSASRRAVFADDAAVVELPDEASNPATGRYGW